MSDKEVAKDCKVGIEHTYNLGLGFQLDINKEYQGSCFSVQKLEYGNNTNFLGHFRMGEEDTLMLISALVKVATIQGLDYNKINAKVTRAMAEGIADIQERGSNN